MEQATCRLPIPLHNYVVERLKRNHLLTIDFKCSEVATGCEMVVVAQHWKCQTRALFNLTNRHLHFGNVEECFKPGKCGDVVLAENKSRGGKRSVFTNKRTD